MIASVIFASLDIGFERERERERERGGERERERGRGRETERQTERETQREKEFYFETFGYSLEIKCGTWTKVQVCASDTREEIGL